MSVCLCTPTISFWMRQQIFMKLRMYIMAPQSISTAYFISPSHQSVCNPFFVAARQKRYRGKKYKCENRRIFGRIIFCTVRVISRKVADYLFSEFPVSFSVWFVSYERKVSLVLPRTSYLFCMVTCSGYCYLLITVSTEDEQKLIFI
jgi:hypothetical protein